jgi:teichuronic acid biosynthesis glycosyltransferase TuaG
MITSNIKFSIVIPYYNSINTIERALDSVLFQTFNDYEVILINDGSKDLPIDLIHLYRDKFASIGCNFKYIDLVNNLGPSIARNTGWENAIGDYVCFLDADDMWHPIKLKICEVFIDKVNPELIFHNSAISDMGNLANILELDYSIKKYNVFKSNKYKWILKNLAVTPSVLVKREIKLRFNDKMKYCEDYDLWLRIAFSHKSIFQIKGPELTFLGKPPMTGNGLSSKILKMRIGEINLFVNFALKQTIFIPILPILILYSTLKHLRLLILNTKYYKF